MSKGSRASFDHGSVVLTDSGENHDYEVVWHGGMTSPHGGFTKGELLEPRDSFTHPMWEQGMYEGAGSIAAPIGSMTHRNGSVINAGSGNKRMAAA